MPEKEAASNVRMTPPRETFVVVGWVKGVAHPQWILKQGKYNFRMGSTPGALRLSAQVVGATYLLLHGGKAEAVPGLFKISNPADGPRVYSRGELKTMAYPTEPTQDAYLVYDVEPADEFAGTDWGYAELPGKPPNAALGHPFAVSLQDLLLVSKRKLL